MARAHDKAIMAAQAVIHAPSLSPRPIFGLVVVRSPIDIVEALCHEMKS
jgi:hypothetical protein